MHVTYRFLRPNDRRRLRELLQYCFLLTEEQVHNWVDDSMPGEWLLGGYDGGDLVTATIVQPRELVGRRTAMVATIAGVATAPQARGRGLARGLMMHVLRGLREQRIPWAILHPFDFAFYHRLGWGQGTPMVRISLKDLRLLKRDSSPGVYRFAGAAEWETLDGIHHAWSSTGSGALVRTRREWLRLLERPLSPRTCVIWDNGSDSGYAVYELRRSPGTARLDGVCTVHDWAWTAPAARDALLSYVANHAGQVGRVDMKVAEDDPLTNLEGEGVERTLARGPMVRLVDVALCGEEAPGDGEEVVAVRVRDSQCPWNNGCFLLGKNETLSAGSRSEPPLLDMDIAALSSLLWGSLSVETAHRCGLFCGAHSSTLPLIERLVPRSPPFFLDWF